MRVDHARPRPHPVPGRPAQRSVAGQATPLVAVALIVAAALVLGVVGLGRSVRDAAQARTAADAAALAGAAEGPAAATALAEANGGRVTTYRAEGDEVTVTVAVGRGRATAAAA